MSLWCVIVSSSSDGETPLGGEGQEEQVAGQLRGRRPRPPLPRILPPTGEAAHRHFEGRTGRSRRLGELFIDLILSDTDTDTPMGHC